MTTRVYKTPDVYVEEVPTLPPSVAEVATAIPAFVGHTEKGSGVARVGTLLEYEALFGRAAASTFAVKASVDAATNLPSVDEIKRGGNAPPGDGPPPGHEFLLHPSVSLYFKNGGGPCYIVSVGGYDEAPSRAGFDAGLAALEAEDEPTLIVLTDAVNLPDADYYALCQDALAQCAKLDDRFAILDVKGGDVAAFREQIGTNDLMYGAAYHPYLKTSLARRYEDDQVKVKVGNDDDVTLASLRGSKTALYNKVKAALAEQRVTLPPSGAVAGVYARVDRDRGVWKAPANVSLASVEGPALKISSEGQEALNVDPTAGKSINAIRAFTGKGTLVWGARTLAGNDNEWRYVSVRRLFLVIEESAKKSTSFAVFEPNDATTWLKVKGMIESYLLGLWERGALAGPTPDKAFFVNVGLGKTMTTQDVLEGRMIVEVGVAPVRPAEFVILRFTHKLQEA